MNLLQALKKAEETRRPSDAVHRVPDTLSFSALDLQPLQQTSAVPTKSHIDSIPAPRMDELEEQQPPFAPSGTAQDATSKSAPATISPSSGEIGTHPQNVRPLLSVSRARPSHSRTAWLLLGGCILLGGMGAWLWWQLQPLTAPAELPDIHTAETHPVSAVTEKEEDAPTSASALIALTPAPLHPTATPSPKSPQTVHQPAGDKAAYIEAQPTPANMPKIERSIEEEAIPAPLEAAWQAWQRGDVATAEIHYRRMLASSPHNRDAQLGFAALAARQGQKTQAAQVYQQLLALNPQDKDALAGLLLLHPEALSESAEAQLLQQSDQSNTPNVLGQYYAAHKRWHEAQEQYFQAFVRAPDNADLAFNLAVSLDHIGQTKLAADYYHRALVLMPGSFDRITAQQRLVELSIEQP